jgi:hypothetical protein
METISFYLDEMVSRKIAEQGRVLVTFDRPFAARASHLTDHAGLICLTCSQDDIGAAIRALTEFADNHTPEGAVGRVFWF